MRDSTGTLVLFMLLIIFIGAAFYIMSSEPPINDFDSCVGAGNPVTESYPRQCRTTDGSTFTENLSIGFG